MVQHIGTFSTGHVVTAAEMNALGPYWSSGAGAPSGTGANSDTYYDTTNKRTYVSDGTGWVILSEPAQSYTPTVAGWSIGNGTLAAYYHRSDGWIDVKIKCTAGSTTTFGAPTFTLPIAASSGDELDASKCLFYDASAAIRYGGMTFASSTSVVGVLASKNDATYESDVAISSTIPFAGGAAWTTGDIIVIHVRYRMTTRYS